MIPKNQLVINLSSTEIILWIWKGIQFLQRL